MYVSDFGPVNVRSLHIQTIEIINIVHMEAAG